MLAHISVVVPTRDRHDALARCVSAIRAGARPEVEIVVVDDGSSDAAGAFAAAGGDARLVRLDGAGPAAARNAGVDAARASVICFIDDDCEPTPDWLEWLVAPIDSGDADIVVGRTVSAPRAAAVVRASQTITNHLVAEALEPDGTVAFGPTCNLAVRADALRSVPFDERFPSAAGEDRDWCDRATAVGVVMRYEPTAVVVHRPDLDVVGFLRQQLRYGRGARLYRSVDSRRSGAWPVAFYARLIRRGFREGAGVGLLVLAAQAMTAVGYAVEVLSPAPVASAR